MDKRDQAILEWIRAHQPQLVDSMEAALVRRAFDQRTFVTYTFMMLAFEAGRKFQCDNPALTVDNLGQYQ